MEQNQRPFGFADRGERKESDPLEREGVAFLVGPREPYQMYVGKMVEVFNGNTTFGVYRGTNEHGMIVLAPHLNREYTPFDFVDNKGINQYFWDECPAFVVGVSKICGANGKHLDKTVEKSVKEYQRYLDHLKQVEENQEKAPSMEGQWYTI